MAVIGTHPVIAVVVLFVVFFAIFFLLIYGILQYAESRKKGREVEETEEKNPGQIPTFVKSKTCSYCGTTMPGIASFCPECGSPQIAAR